MHRRTLLPFLIAGCTPQPQSLRLTGYSTSLAGRSAGQLHNARWAARQLDGAELVAGQLFSFNRHCGPWTRDTGVIRAPVSFGGILVTAWGGGVCQVSTTLYGAALLAGLIIQERHPHAVAPAYVPTGLDAAVAFGLADLGILNPLAYPLRVEAKIRDARLTVELWRPLPSTPPPTYRLVRELVTLHAAPLIAAVRPQQGRAGQRVRLWRINTQTSARELCHETEYAALPQTVG